VKIESWHVVETIRLPKDVRSIGNMDRGVKNSKKKELQRKRRKNNKIVG